MVPILDGGIITSLLSFRGRQIGVMFICKNVGLRKSHLMYRSAVCLTQNCPWVGFPRVGFNWVGSNVEFQKISVKLFTNP